MPLSLKTTDHFPVQTPVSAHIADYAYPGFVENAVAIPESAIRGSPVGDFRWRDNARLRVNARTPVPMSVRYSFRAAKKQ